MRAWLAPWLTNSCIPSGANEVPEGAPTSTSARCAGCPLAAFREPADRVIREPPGPATDRLEPGVVACFFSFSVVSLPGATAAGPVLLPPGTDGAAYWLACGTAALSPSPALVCETPPLG